MWRPSSATVSFLRPLARRAAKTRRPFAVAILSKKPCLLRRLRWDGWNVRFIVLLLFYALSQSGFTQNGLQRYCFFLTYANFSAFFSHFHAFSALFPRIFFVLLRIFCLISSHFFRIAPHFLPYFLAFLSHSPAFSALFPRIFFVLLRISLLVLSLFSAHSSSFMHKFRRTLCLRSVTIFLTYHYRRILGDS